MKKPETISEASLEKDGAESKEGIDSGGILKDLLNGFRRLVRMVFGPSAEAIKEKLLSMGLPLDCKWNEEVSKHDERGSALAYLRIRDGRERLRLYENLERLSANMQDPVWAENARKHVLQEASVLKTEYTRHAYSRGGMAATVNWSAESSEKIPLAAIPEAIIAKTRQAYPKKLEAIYDTQIDPVTWVRNLLRFASEIKVDLNGLNVSVNLGTNWQEGKVDYTLDFNWWF